MTYLKCNADLYYSFILIIFCSCLTLGLTAQSDPGLRLSGAVAVGYAPKVTHGSTENSGLVLGLYGELEYGKAIGRLQFTTPLLSTFGADDNLNGGKSYHGSLGYRIDIDEQFAVSLMASGGATVIQYNNGFNGSSGDTFTNVSPQAGINIVPTYQISDLLSVQAGLRYYKGFKAGDRGKASDLADVSIGVRFSL